MRCFWVGMSKVHIDLHRNTNQNILRYNLFLLHNHFIHSKINIQIVFFLVIHHLKVFFLTKLKDSREIRSSLRSIPEFISLIRSFLLTNNSSLLFRVDHRVWLTPTNPLPRLDPLPNNPTLRNQITWLSKTSKLNKETNNSYNYNSNSSSNNNNSPYNNNNTSNSSNNNNSYWNSNKIFNNNNKKKKTKSKEFNKPPKSPKRRLKTKMRGSMRIRQRRKISSNF